MALFVEGGRWSPEEFYELVKDMPTTQLLRELTDQKRALEGFSDRFPSNKESMQPGPFPKLPSEPLPGFQPPMSPDMMEDLGRSMEDEIPPRAGEFQEDYHRYYQPIVPYVDPDLPEPVRRSIEEGGFYGPEAANGGPILASEYLNAGGPVQYFWTGGESITDADVADVAAQEADAVNAALDEAGLTEGFKGLLPEVDRITQGSLLTGAPVLPFGGDLNITPEQAATITADTFDALSPQQLAAFNASNAIRNAIDPFAAGQSRRGQAVQTALGQGQGLAVQQAIARNLQAPVVGSFRAAAARAKGEQSTPGFGFFVSSNAEGGPILASERLNAGGPVQYFNEGQGVSAPDYPGEEPGPPGSAVDYSGQVSVATPDGQAAGPAADQSKDQSRSLTDTAITYGTSALKSGAAAAALSPFGILGSFITTPMMANSFFTGMRNAQEGLDVESKNLAEAAGKFANQKLGLALSKNQAYPGDYGYGLDPDKDFSNQTAFSPTISRYSSDFDVDDPLQGGQ
tara:strand:+ start:752 stop:2293 length:1542 start_codon:yes stop_codon:yes gene_type:complete